MFSPQYTQWLGHTPTAPSHLDQLTAMGPQAPRGLSALRISLFYSKPALNIDKPQVPPIHSFSQKHLSSTAVRQALFSTLGNIRDHEQKRPDPRPHGADLVEGTGKEMNK